jgi:hypothetical protein
MSGDSTKDNGEFYMRLICANCGASIYLDLKDDEKAKRELIFAQSLPCNPHKPETTHKFNRLG